MSHLKLKAGVIDNDDYFCDPKYTKKDLHKLCEAYEIIVAKSKNKKQLNDCLVTAIKQCDSMLTPQIFSDMTETNVDAASIANQLAAESSSMTGGQQSKGKGKGRGKRTKQILSLADTDSPSTSYEAPINLSSNVRVLEEGQKKEEKGKGKGKRNVKISRSKRTSKKQKRNQGESLDEHGNNCCSVCLGKNEDSSDWIQCDNCDNWVHRQCAGITVPEEWDNYTNEAATFFCSFCQ